MPSAFRRKGAQTKRVLSSPSGIASTSSSPSNTNSSNTTVSSLFRLRGVKPWQGGAYLTSSGLNDLDSILGGGHVLGTSILLEEDRLWTRNLAITLVKYWCAEAISQDQHLVIPIFSKPPLSDAEMEDDTNLSFLFRDDASISSEDDEVLSKDRREELEDVLSSLPRNLHWDKQKKREEKAKIEQEQEGNNSNNNSGLGSSLGLEAMTILEEEDEEEAEEQKADEGLEIAWQYKKSVQQERLAQSNTSTSSMVNNNVFCHSYDLSGRMIDQNLLDIPSFIAQLPSSTIRTSTTSSQSKAYKLFYDLVVLLKEKISISAREGTDKAIRVLLYHPPIETLAIALPLLLAHIRKESLPVVIMICISPNDDVKSYIRLARSCDVVLATEGFASRKEYPPPPEFRHLQGVLKISKTTRKRSEIAASIYGFKRDRRKLHIPLLHIPPEDYAEGGGSVAAGGVRSGAGRPASEAPSKPKKTGMGCSSNSSGSSVLDF